MERRPVDHLFPEARRAEAIASSFCAAKPFGCGEPITDGFRDDLSRREYAISGLCQTCQDEFWGV